MHAHGCTNMHACMRIDAQICMHECMRTYTVNVPDGEPDVERDPHDGERAVLEDVVAPLAKGHHDRVQHVHHHVDKHADL